MKIKFDEVKLKVTRKWKDPETGKPRQATREFYQTVNPFNKGTDGLPKTREQIAAEVQAEAIAWRADGEPACSDERPCLPCYLDQGECLAGKAA